MTQQTLFLHRYSAREELVTALTGQLARAVTGAVEAGRRASLVLSGGSSPLPLYRALAGTSLPWAQTDLLLSDERWVPAQHEQSNEGMIRRELMQGEAAAATLLPMYRADHADPVSALGTVERTVERAARPFDSCLLGMGDDGHTASLFPDASGLARIVASPRLVAPVTVPRLSHPRITLTPHALLQSREIILLFFGEEKWSVFEHALDGDDRQRLPVRIVLQQEHVPVHVYWAP